MMPPRRMLARVAVGLASAALLGALTYGPFAAYTATGPTAAVADRCNGPDPITSFKCRNNWVAFLRQSYR